MIDLIPKKALVQSPNGKGFEIVFVGLMFLLSLVPLILLLRILKSTGADSVSNDYLQFIKLANRIISSGYDWRFYFKDTLFNDAHSYAFLFLFRLGIAQLSHLSVMTEIYIGLVLASINVGLEYVLLTRSFERLSIWRFFLLPILSFFSFSFSQISTYSYGETTLQMGFVHLGILIGLWVILFYRQTRFSAWIMMVCGILASFSGGSGLLAWPVFLLAVILTDRFSVRKYIAWFMGLGLGLFPYLAYSSFSPFIGKSSFFFISPLSKLVIVLGISMANNINFGVLEHQAAFAAGLMGLTSIFVIGLIFIISRSKYRFQSSITPILFIFWGLAGAVQIAISRITIAPWYSTTSMLFWIGLSGLYFVLLKADPVTVSNPRLNWNAIFKISGAGWLMATVILFVFTNSTYQDKSLFLSSRSPASAACLRNYRIAPTYCEGLVFQWGVGNPFFLSQLGSILEKYHWSVQSPDQQWTLQGDSILGRVSLASNSKSNEIDWVMGDQDDATNWLDYHHLNILLYPGQTIQWQVELPQNLDSAQLQMGLSLTDKTLCDQQSMVMSLEIPSTGEEKSLFHQQGVCDLANGVSITENLLAYAGKRVNILLSNPSDFLVRDTAIRMHYPQIDLHKTISLQRDEMTPFDIQPLNTDLSPNFVSRISADGISPVLLADKPELSNFILRNNDGLLLRNGSLAQARYDLPQPGCLSKLSQLYFSLALTDALQKKRVRILFSFVDENKNHQETYIDFPLLGGEDLHSYTLDLTFLNLPPSDCISSVSFQVVDELTNSADQWLQIEKVGFLPRK